MLLVVSIIEIFSCWDDHTERNQAERKNLLNFIQADKSFYKFFTQETIVYLNL